VHAIGERAPIIESGTVVQLLPRPEKTETASGDAITLLAFVQVRAIQNSRFAWRPSGWLSSAKILKTTPPVSGAMGRVGRNRAEAIIREY
jgi:hypothetical protein